MLVRLHKKARTTPAIRAELQNSTLSERKLAALYGISRSTVRKWKYREDVCDRSHRPHNLRTTLTPAQEAVVVELRRTLLLPLDDLLVITREFINPAASRSALDRCLRRHGVSNLKDLIAEDDTPKQSKTFKDYVPGFVHIDVKYLPQMPDEPKRRYLFVACERATRWVYLELLPDKSAHQSKGFLQRLIDRAPFKIKKVLTDNGKEFTDRFAANGERIPTGKHPFDQVCQAHGIEHRLIRPRHPQTNGMVERFNGRIEEVLQSHHFHSGEELETTLHRYVALYNQQLPQSALGSKTPLQAMKDWHKLKPELFRKQPYYLPGCDS